MRRPKRRLTVSCSRMLSRRPMCCDTAPPTAIYLFRDPFDGPFYDLSFTPWFADRAAAIRARRERTDFEARVLSRYDEIAAALAAWTLADEAALDAAGLPAIEAVERRAYRRRHSTFGRLLAMAAKTPVGVAQKLAAVAEQIDLDDADEPRTTPQAIEALFRSAARDALRIVPLA